MVRIKNLIDKPIIIAGISIKQGQIQEFDIKIDKDLQRLRRLNIIAIKEVIEVPIEEPIIVEPVVEQPVIEEVITKPKRTRKKKEGTNNE